MIFYLIGFENDVQEDVYAYKIHSGTMFHMFQLPDNLERKYIRFGDIPKNELSLNHQTNEHEKGVSVYLAVLYNGIYIPLMPQRDSDNVYVTFTYCSYRDAFIVEGEELSERGSDGEPLLKNVKIIEKANLAKADLNFNVEYNPVSRDKSYKVDQLTASNTLNRVGFINID